MGDASDTRLTHKLPHRAISANKGRKERRRGRGRTRRQNHWSFNTTKWVTRKLHCVFIFAYNMLLLFVPCTCWLYRIWKSSIYEELYIVALIHILFLIYQENIWCQVNSGLRHCKSKHKKSQKRDYFSCASCPTGHHTTPEHNTSKHNTRPNPIPTHHT